MYVCVLYRNLEYLLQFASYAYTSKLHALHLLPFYLLIYDPKFQSLAFILNYIDITRENKFSSPCYVNLVEHRR